MAQAPTDIMFGEGITPLIFKVEGRSVLLVKMTERQGGCLERGLYRRLNAACSQPAITPAERLAAIGLLDGRRLQSQWRGVGKRNVQHVAER